MRWKPIVGGNNQHLSIPGNFFALGTASSSNVKDQRAERNLYFNNSMKITQFGEMHIPFK